MALLENKYEKKSFIITTALYVLLILLLLFLGLKYYDPPKEKGILVNFGTTEMGQGNTQPTTPAKTSPQQNIPEPTPQPQTQPSNTEIKEEVATQDTEEAPVIKEEKEKKEIKPEKNEPKKKEPQEEKPETPEKPVEKPVEEVPEKKPNPKPDKAVTDAMDNLLNGPKNDGKSQNGEGNDQTAGDKGDPDGDPNAKSYYGTGKGLDGDGNYKLGGRKALNKTKYTQDCNEAGTVVVKIEVDKNGKVLNATPGAQGTTNSAACLLRPAKRAAMDTKFNQDANAPSRQVGYIVYVFKLSD